MKIVILILLLIMLSTSSAQWKPTSGPEGGLINAIGTSGSSTIFAATSNNGVFRSIDNGAHWAASGLSNLSIGGFIFKGNYVFAIDQNQAIWRSSNNGNSWTNLNFTDYIGCYTVKGNYIFVENSQGVVRSSDNGISWVLANNGISSYVFSMASNSNYLFAGGNEMIFRSSDNGNNWIQYNLPAGAGTIYSMITNGSTLLGSGAGVYRSTNSGVNWVLSGLDSLTISSFTKSGTSIIGMILGGTYPGEIVRTDNNGVSWKIVNSDIISTDFSSITSNDQYIFTGFYIMGISRSSTKGNDWVVSNTGLKAMDINHIISMDNDLYAGNESGGGIFYSANNGDSWTDYNIGLKDLNIYTFAVNANTSTIYAGTDDGIYYTSPSNDIWTPLNNGLTGLNTTSIAVNGKKMYTNAGGKQLYISTNGGLKWDTLGLKVTGFTNIRKIALGSNIIYASLTWHHHSVTNSWLEASIDGGITWNDTISNQVPAEGITEVIAKGNDVFFGATGVSYRADSSKLGVYRSTNKGTNWTLVKNGMSDHNISSLCYSNNDIIAGTYSGNIYRSTNKGDNWIVINSGLPANKAVNTLTVNNSYLFSGINNNSVWKYPLPKNIPAGSVSQYKGNNILNQNNPNPFNPVTKIKYQIAVKGFVSLKIYDITGREVATLVNEVKESGYYTAEFDGTKLASGVYFYRLSAEGNSQKFERTLKMVLIK